MDHGHGEGGDAENLGDGRQDRQHCGELELLLTPGKDDGRQRGRATIFEKPFRCCTVRIGPVDHDRGQLAEPREQGNARKRDDAPVHSTPEGKHDGCGRK